MLALSLAPWAGTWAGAQPPQCAEPNVNLYAYPASVAQACGFTTVPLAHVAARPDGGRDYIYSINGHDADSPEPPGGFDPQTASDAQLSYYGFPPRPAEPAALSAWQAEVSRLHVAPPTQFLIEVPGVATAGNLCAAAGSPVRLCWGGYMNTGQTFTASYLDYTEPGEAQTNCQNDAVLNWTGLGGYNGTPLAQDGTAPFLANTSHYAWWEVFPQNGITFFNFEAHRGDDIQAHVWWLSASSEYKMTVTDTSTGATGTAYWAPNRAPDLSTAEYIVERPQSQTYVYPLRNFWTGWSTVSAQAATGGGNTIGMQNYSLTKVDIFNKSGTQLETTNGHTADHFTAAWDACG